MSLEPIVNMKECAGYCENKLFVRFHFNWLLLTIFLEDGESILGRPTVVMKNIKRTLSYIISFRYI